MTEIKILYDKIYSENLNRDPKHFIDLYDENKNLIEGADPSTSNPDYDGIMRITSEYALSLSHYGSSRKAIPYLDKSIQLFKDRSVDDLTKVPMYEMLVWTRGVEHYNNKNYKTASQDFQYLVYTYPDNDKYRNWLLASKTIKAKKYLNYIWGFAFMSFIWYSLATKDGDTNRDYFLMATGVFVLIGILVEIANSILKSSIKQK